MGIKENLLVGCQQWWLLLMLTFRVLMMLDMGNTYIK